MDILLNEVNVFYRILEDSEECPDMLNEMEYTVIHIPTGKTLNRRIALYHHRDSMGELLRLLNHWNHNNDWKYYC